MSDSNPETSEFFLNPDADMGAIPDGGDQDFSDDTSSSTEGGSDSDKPEVIDLDTYFPLKANHEPSGKDNLPIKDESDDVELLEVPVKKEDDMDVIFLWSNSRGSCADDPFDLTGDGELDPRTTFPPIIPLSERELNSGADSLQKGLRKFIVKKPRAVKDSPAREVLAGHKKSSDAPDSTLDTSIVSSIESDMPTTVPSVPNATATHVARIDGITQGSNSGTNNDGLTRIPSTNANVQTTSPESNINSATLLNGTPVVADDDSIMDLDLPDDFVDTHQADTDAAAHRKAQEQAREMQKIIFATLRSSKKLSQPQQSSEIDKDPTRPLGTRYGTSSNAKASSIDIEQSDGEDAHRENERTLKRLKRKKHLTDLEKIELKRAQSQHEQRKNRNAQSEKIFLDGEDPFDNRDDDDPDKPDHAAEQARRLRDKAMSFRYTSKANLQRKRNIEIVQKTMLQHELDSRAKEDKRKERAATKKQREEDADKKRKRKRKETVDNDHDDAAADKPERRRNKKKKIENKKEEKKQNPRKTPKKKRTKKDAEDHEAFLKMIQGLGNDNLEEGSDERDQPGSAPRLGKNRNREEFLQELIADIPTEEQKSANKTRTALRKACQTFAKGSVSPGNESGYWNVKGLLHPLRHHQLLGAAWMLRRERGTNNPQGSILADMMGLGKTFQALVVMHAERANYKNPAATLVVCPVDVVQVWKAEIEKHMHRDRCGAILTHRAGFRLDGVNIELTMENAFCVITTYSEVLVSLKSAKCPKELVTEDQVRNWYATQAELGPLHKINWHRIILDEGHFTKNFAGATAHACFMLQSKRRWILTGSPFLNSVDELYSYMNFLRMPVAGSREQFLNNFTGSEEALSRTQQTLKAIMLRRTYNDKIFSTKLINLPRHFRANIEIDFTRLERAIYNIFRARMAMNININIKKKHRAGRYRYVLRMITQVRQMTAHFMLGAETFRNMLTVSDRERVMNIVTEYEQGAGEHHVTKKFRKLFADADAEARGRTAASPGGDNGGGIFGAQDPTAKEILDQIDSLADADEDRHLCKLCSSLLDDTVVETSCGHLFHTECIDHQADCAKLDEQQKISCVECETEFERSELVHRVLDSPKQRQQDEKAHKENRDHSWISNGDCVISSTKTLATKAQIQNWFDEDEKEKRLHQERGTSEEYKPCKIIIYTQWIPITKCLARICEGEGWSCTTYTGQKSIQDREASLKKFTQSKERSILIATLKAGGVGLNLTAANKVIILDLWWNYGVEAQCFHRVYRLGQTKETEVKRIVVRDTVDEDMIKMQDFKLGGINTALGEGGVKKTSMPIEMLMSLFGQVEQDKDGDPFIIPDYDSHARTDLEGPYRGGHRGVGVSFDPAEVALDAP